MDLDISEGPSFGPAVVAGAIRVAAEMSHRLAHRDSTGVDAVEVCGIERPRHRRAAQVGRPKAQPFLIGKCEHFECEGRASRGVAKALNGGDGDDHP